jgi:hypothetical protein
VPCCEWDDLLTNRSPYGAGYGTIPYQYISDDAWEAFATPVVPEIFVSYKWGGDAEALVDQIQDRLAGRGVIVIRDKSEMKYRDSIRKFMGRIGAGKLIIVVLD